MFNPPYQSSDFGNVINQRRFHQKLVIHLDNFMEVRSMLAGILSRRNTASHR
jgi:hypothetical protein